MPESRWVRFVPAVDLEKVEWVELAEVKAEELAGHPNHGDL